MAPPRKTIKQYEQEAKQLKNGCLVHPSWGAARKIYEMRHGNYYPRGNGSGLCVCHTCDNAQCIEDKHHFLGTRKDNVMDAVLKGRHSCFRKGGVRFSGPHTQATKKKIGEASKRAWNEGAHAYS